MTTKVAVEVDDPVTSFAVAVTEYVPRGRFVVTTKLNERAIVYPAGTLNVSPEVVKLLVWPDGLM